MKVTYHPAFVQRLFGSILIFSLACGTLAGGVHTLLHVGIGGAIFIILGLASLLFSMRVILARIVISETEIEFVGFLKVSRILREDICKIQTYHRGTTKAIEFVLRDGSILHPGSSLMGRNSEVEELVLKIGNIIIKDSV